MNLVFEHDSLKKAGRAIFIVSLLLVISNGCIGALSNMKFFGVETHFSLGDLRRLLLIALVFYTLIFVYRLVEANPIFVVNGINATARKRKDEQKDYLVDYYNDDIKKLDRMLQSGRMSEEHEAARVRRSDLQEMRNAKISRRGKYIDVIRFFQVAFFLLSEVFVPVLSAGAAIGSFSYGQVAEMVCPSSYAAMKATQSSSP